MLLSSAESNQRLIAWNFATMVVHQRANRKFPRRYFKQNGESLRVAIWGLSLGRTALEDTVAASSKAFVAPLGLHLPSGLRKRSGCNTRHRCLAISCNVASKALTLFTI